jgi:hypothetical protein
MPIQVEDRKEQGHRPGNAFAWLLGHSFGLGCDRPGSAVDAKGTGETFSHELMIKPSTHLRVAVGAHRQEWP